MGDAVLSLEDPGALEFDLLCREAVEQPSSLAEEHRDDMELHLVEDAGGRVGASSDAGTTSFWFSLPG